MNERREGMEKVLDILSTIRTDQAVQKRMLEINSEKTDQMHKAIFGNGSEGINTKVALNKQNIIRLWITLGSIIPLVIGGLTVLKLLDII